MDLLVYGSREFGRLVRDHVEACGHRFCGYVDDHAKGPDILGTYDAVLNDRPPEQRAIALGVGYKDLARRRVLVERLQRDGWALPALIHPHAWVRDCGSIQAGSIVMALASVALGAVVQEACVLWNGVVVSHDSTIGSNTFLSPGATICGFVQVGRDCFVGAGAVVVDHRHVPDGSFIKAGQVVA